MPKGCPWLFVGNYFRDDMCSCAWSMYISRDGHRDYHVKIDGEELYTDVVGGILPLIGFFEDYGDNTLADLRDTLECLPGTAEACKMINVRLARWRQTAAA